MDTLILLRHGKAAPEGEAESDRDRRLVDRGRADARSAGEALAALGLAPDIALASPALRTRETVELALSALGGGPEARFDERLYMAPASLIFAIAAAERAERVLIVGHNPGLHELAIALVRQAQDQSAAARGAVEALPTAGMLAFALSGEVFEAAGPRLIASWRPART